MCDNKIKIKLRNFDKICRLCLKESVFLKPLFSEGGEISDDFASDNSSGNESVTEMLTYCTGITISLKDKLPKFLCSKCLSQLLQSNKFRRQCLHSKEILEGTIKRHENGEEEYSGNDLFPALIENEDANYSVGFENLMNADEDDSVYSRGLFPLPPTKLSFPDNPDDSETLNEEISRVQSSTLEVNSVGNLEGNTRCFRNLMINQIRKLKKKTVFECETCKEKFLNSNRLNHHKIKHEETRFIRCKYCKREFLTRYELIKHSWMKHSKQNKFRCRKCKRFFRNERILYMHWKFHLLEAPKRCKLCGKIFTNASILKYHLEHRHLGEHLI